MNSVHPDVTGTVPVPPQPPQVRAPRRWPWVLVVVGAACALALLARRSDTVLEVLHRTGQRLAGLGELRWEDPGGDWHDIAPSNDARLTWSAETAFLVPAWHPVAAGLDAADLSLARPPHPQTVVLALYRLVPARWNLHVVGYPDWVEHPLPDFTAKWGFSLAVNASFFSSEGPIGLVIQDGVLRHRQASRKAAHFLVDTRAGSVRIENQKMAGIAGVYAGFQGFPAMMTNGRLYSYVASGGRGFDVFTVDRRSAACTDREGRVILMVTDSLTNGLSFAELGVLMGGLGCVDGMAFDGGSSTALDVTIAGHERHVQGLNPVQVVLGLTPRG